MSDSAEQGGRHGAQGEPATPDSPVPGHETPAPGSALAVRPPRKLDERPREGGMLKHRLDRVRDLVAQRYAKQLLKDTDTIAMAEHAFKDDVELALAYHRGQRLTRRQQRLAREWEKPKKEAAIALSAAQERVVNAMRAQAEQKGLSINVERFVVRVPDTKASNLDEAIIVDAEVMDASR